MPLGLYLIYQNENNGYDSYDSAVVIAESEKEAQSLDPFDGKEMAEDKWNNTWSSWCSSPEKVKVEYLGKAKKGSQKGLVCSSFNAG
jgi:hypothetical protein